MNQLTGGFRTIVRSENQFSLTSLSKYVVLGAVLVSIGVSADNDWFCPARHKSGNVFDNDWFAEDCSVKDVSNCSVGGLPHLLKVELFNSAFIWSNCCTFNTNFVF